MSRDLIGLVVAACVIVAALWGILTADRRGHHQAIEAHDAWLQGHRALEEARRRRPACAHDYAHLEEVRTLDDEVVAHLCPRCFEAVTPNPPGPERTPCTPSEHDPIQIVSGYGYCSTYCGTCGTYLDGGRRARSTTDLGPG